MEEAGKTRVQYLLRSLQVSCYQETPITGLGFPTLDSSFGSYDNPVWLAQLLFPLFMDGVTKAQNRSATCLRPHSWSMRDLGLKPRASDLSSVLFGRHLHAAYFGPPDLRNVYNFYNPSPRSKSPFTASQSNLSSFSNPFIFLSPQLIFPSSGISPQTFTPHPQLWHSTQTLGKVLYISYPHSTPQQEPGTQPA